MFAQTVLQHETWWGQEDILDSVDTNPYTAVKACHSSSKTFSAAEIVLYWLAKYDDGVAVTTAPTERQVRNLVWKEIRHALNGCLIAMPRPNQLSLTISDKNYAFGMSTRSDSSADAGVRFQGIHSGHVLIVLDEAVGIATEIWEAIEGIRASGVVRVLAIGNPTVPSGGFYEIFHHKRDTWNCITIDAFDTPNLEGIGLADDGIEGKTDLLELDDEALDDNRASYLVSRRWVKERFIEWGVESPRWQARVRGQFPKQSEFALIPLVWLEEAQAAWKDQASGKLWSAGVDVAGPGESETVVYVVDNGRIVDMAAWGKPDPRGECLKFLRQYERELGTVNVDEIGIGYYFAKHLRDNGLPISMVNVGNASGSEEYKNLKAELYWRLRMAFEEGRVSNLTDETTISQLAGILYEETAKGQTVIESKESMRKRGMRSPDRAEALMLAFSRTPGGMSLQDVGSELRRTPPRP